MATKIIGLQIENLRKIKAAEMQFEESGLIQIRGENGQGKTTVLDALMILFQGDRARPGDMVKHGEKKAKITVDLGLYTVEKIFANDGTPKLSITEKATNLPVKNPQKFLTDMVNQISFNPFNFLNLTPLEKNRFLMKLLKIDFTEINKKLELLENERTVTGREVDRFGVVEPVNPAEKVSLKDLYEAKKTIEDENRILRNDYEKQSAAEHHKTVIYASELAKYTQALSNNSTEIENLEARKQRNIAEIKRLQAENSSLTMDILKAEEFGDQLVRPVEPIINRLPDPSYKSTTNIDNQIENAEALNIKAHEYAKYLEKRAEKQKLKDQYEALTGQIEDLRQQKLKILSETPTGVEGLIITEDAVYHNETYSENWSDAQGIDIAAQLCITQNPELRAVFIDKGESFDKKRLKLLQDWAVAHDLQAFLTIVSEIPENLEDGIFYVEDGNIIIK